MSSTQRPTDLRALIAEELPEIVALRRDLHRHPELMYQEHRTMGVVCRELDAMDLPYRSGLAGGTGVLAYLPAEGAASSRPAVALRADMDALPIVEASGVPHASITEGVMHACGHDGHVAILLGAARVLSRLQARPRPVRFLFQPAEEGGRGGERMLREGALGEGGGEPGEGRPEDGAMSGGAAAGLGPAVARIYGLHGWPTLPLGSVATRAGAIMAGVAVFDLVIEGEGGHGAIPDRARDPIVAAAHVITALQTVVSRSLPPVEAGVLSVTAVDAGSAYNVIPPRARLKGTARALSPEAMARLRERCGEIATDVARALGCEARLDWREVVPPTVNDGPAAQRVLALGRQTLGAERAIPLDAPSMAGEDFAFYGEAAASCFFWLGLCPPGEDPDARPGLHQPSFDFNDEALPVGIEMMVRLALQDD